MDDHPLSPGGGVRLTLQPVTITEAQAFVERHHRHHKAPQGGLFAVGVGLGDVVRAAAAMAARWPIDWIDGDRRLTGWRGM